MEKETIEIESLRLYNLGEALSKRGAITIASDLSQLLGKMARLAEENLTKSQEEYYRTISIIEEAHHSIGTAIAICRICEGIMADYKRAQAR